MASPVYSFQLAAQVNYIGTLDVLVPSGVKLVVRDIDCFHNASGGSADILFQGNVTNLTLWWTFWGGSDTGPGQWRGRQVFETGQKFRIVANDAGGIGVSFQVSGYQLTLP